MTFSERNIMKHVDRTIRRPLYAGLVCLLCAAVQSCMSDGTGDKARTDKLEYEPRTNEVEVIRLEKGEFTRQLVSNGKLSASGRISLHFSGQAPVSGIYFRNGDSVEAGDVIAEQESEDKKIALESARIALARAELDYLDVLAGQGYEVEDTASAPTGVKTMAKVRSGYDAAMNSLVKAELDYAGTVIRAPFSGKVADLSLHRYDMSTSEAFCKLIDDRTLNVDFPVLESEYSFVEKGLPIKVIPYFGDGRSLEGRITAVNPTVDKNGQVAVTAEVENDGTLADGMNVRVIVERTVPDMMVVPKSAVLVRDNKEVLFLYSGGKARWTYVNILMSNSGSHAVTANTDRGSELAPGDTVIISGNLNLADGSEVVIKD